MNKLILILTFLLGSFALIACGKKGDNNNANQCHGYPAGYVAITDQQMLQRYYSYGNNVYEGYANSLLGNNGYGYNNQYNQYNQQNRGVVCVDQQRYQQLYQQTYGNNQNNEYCQIYPQDSYCTNSGNYNGYGNYNNGSVSLYCTYFPYDSFCTGRWY